MLALCRELCQVDQADHASSGAHRARAASRRRRFPHSTCRRNARAS